MDGEAGRRKCGWLERGSGAGDPDGWNVAPEGLDGWAGWLLPSWDLPLGKRFIILGTALPPTHSLTYCESGSL